MLVAEVDVDDVLKRARERSAIRQEFLRKATDAMGQLSGEVAVVDACLEAEGLRLVEERRKLKVAVSLARHQRDLDNAKAETSLVASRKACFRAIEEAQEADRWCEIAEERAWEVQAWCDSLEQQVELRQAALASLKAMPVGEEELQKREEALALEAAQRNLDLERLETREHQVTQAEDDVGAWEVRIREEINRRLAKILAGLVREYGERWELIKAEAAGRTAALRTKLTEAMQCAEATAAALATA
nr:tropomyosin-like [Aegilops tauschii subsp. strangulata]